MILECSNKGYYISIPLSTFDTLPDKGQAKLFTQLFIRDDLITLYGFATTEERDVFKLLISVSGVGAKIALAILSGGPLNDLKESIVGGDSKALGRIKGIGKKTAERLVLELKDSIKSVSTIPASKEKSEKDNIIEDAILALISLGYVRSTAEKAVNDSLTTFSADDGIEALIRLALKNT